MVSDQKEDVERNHAEGPHNVYGSRVIIPITQCL